LSGGRAVANIEKLGIPTVAIVRQGFEEQIRNAVATEGLGSGLAMVVYPNELSLSGSDLSVIAQGVEDIIHGLTKWKPSGQ
jgi:hypothetical protein